MIDDVVYYCVVNMLGGVVCMFIMVLNNVILFFGLVFVNKGLVNVMLEDKYLLNGLNVYEGKVIYKVVVDVLGEKLGLIYMLVEEVLKG